MSQKILTIVALAIAALLAAAMASSVATAAERVEISSRITLKQSDPFQGEVFSRRIGCERNRTVEVYEVTTGPNGLYDSVRSDASGEWSIPAGMPNGKFYAVVKQRKIDTNQRTIVCKQAISAKVEF